jgi:cation diffusion facilitator family transporter
MTTLQIRTREKKRVALSSVIAALAITALKLIVGLQTNSLGILSEAAHSGLDLMAAIMTLVAVSIADRPPDKEHPYGHGKVENISAFIETLLLVVTCTWIISEAVDRLSTGVPHVDATVWGFGVIILSIAVDVSRSRALSRMAKKHKSQALEADALHFSSDVWSSLVVIAGLVFVGIGMPLFDPIAAMIVALLVLFATYRLGRRAINALMDRVPDGLHEELVETIRGVEGVAEVRAVRLRSSGPKIFVDATVAIARTIPFQQAHDVMDRIERAIYARHENAEVMVHAEPFESKDERIADRIRMIILGKGLRAPHNLEILQKDEKYHIDFDIEYTKGKEFVEAHDLSTEIERDIRHEVPNVEKVTIHMEEYNPGEMKTAEGDVQEARLRKEIGLALKAERKILRYSDLTLLKLGKRYNLTVNCQFEKKKTLDEIHQIISDVERKLHGKFKNLRRVTIHAEPG